MAYCDHDDVSGKTGIEYSETSQPTLERVKDLTTQSGRTAYIQLYDVTASTVVATLSTSNGTWTHLSTSASLTNGHYYRVRLRCSESGYYAYMLGSYLEW